MTEVKPATNQLVAALKADFGGRTSYTMTHDESGTEIDSFDVLSLIERIEYEVAYKDEYEAAQSDALAKRDAEIARLKADQSDWRKGVGFIASALGLDSLSCVDIAERALEIRSDRDRLKAEVEHQRTMMQLSAETTATGRAR